MKAKYGVDIDWLFQREDVKDHHKIVDCIAEEAEAEPEVVRTVAIERYIKEIDSEFNALIDAIEHAVA